MIACSALEQAYRTRLAQAPADVRCVYLRASFELILERLKNRQGHSMRAGMLRSQFEILKEPEQAVTVEIPQAADTIILRSGRRLHFRNSHLNSAIPLTPD